MFLLPIAFSSSKQSHLWLVLNGIFDCAIFVRFCIYCYFIVMTPRNVEQLWKFCTIKRIFFIVTLLRVLCHAHASFYSKDGIIVYHPKVKHLLHTKLGVSRARKKCFAQPHGTKQKSFLFLPKKEKKIKQWISNLSIGSKETFKHYLRCRLLYDFIGNFPIEWFGILAGYPYTSSLSLMSNR